MDEADVETENLNVHSLKKQLKRFAGLPISLFMSYLIVSIATATPANNSRNSLTPYIPPRNTVNTLTVNSIESVNLDNLRAKIRNSNLYNYPDILLSESLFNEISKLIEEGKIIPENIQWLFQTYELTLIQLENALNSGDLKTASELLLLALELNYRLQNICAQANAIAEA